MNGRVAGHYALLRVTVCGPYGQTADVEAVLGTGFDGELALPRTVVAALGLLRASTRPAMLGDGTMAELDLYFAAIGWDGRQREVIALQGGPVPLIGMSLLRDHRVVLHVVDGGDVTIDPWP
jgi:clan AA aspartic protease